MSTSSNRPQYHEDHARIKELAKARGYGTSWHWGGAPWLHWRPKVERAGDYPLDKLFDPFELFRYEPTSPYPHLWLHTPHYRISTDAFERIQNSYQVTANRIKGTYKDNLLGALPELNGVLQGTYDLMSRIELRLGGAFKGGRSVIEAWVVETERALLEDGKAELLIERARREGGLADKADEELTGPQRLSRKIRLDRAMSHGGAGELYEAARLFWAYLTRGGVDVDGLTRLFERECQKLHTPHLVTVAQASGLRHYYGLIEPVLAEAWHLNDNRTAYEALHHAILLGEDLPTPEEYADQRRGSERKSWHDLPLHPASTQGHAHGHNTTILGLAYITACEQMSPAEAKREIRRWYEDLSEQEGGAESRQAAVGLADRTLTGYARIVRGILQGIEPAREPERLFTLEWARELGLNGTDRNESEEGGDGG